VVVVVVVVKFVLGLTKYHAVKIYWARRITAPLILILGNTGPTHFHVQSVPGVKWPEREADHSPPTSAKIKNAWR